MGGISVGTTDIESIYIGADEISEVYFGATKIWPAGGEPVAPTIRSAKPIAFGNVRNWSVDVPAGTQAGDFLYLPIFVSSSVTPTITPPTGFTQIETITDFVTHSRLSVFGKVAVGSYSAGAKFNGSFDVYNYGSVGACVAIIGSSNAETAAAHTPHTAMHGSPITATAPSVTPPDAASLALAVVVIQNASDYNDETDPFTFNDGQTKVIAAAHGDRALAIGAKTLVSATATGDLTTTITHAYSYRQSAWLARLATVGPA